MNNINYEQLLLHQDQILAPFKGTSMMPLLREDIDTVVLKKASETLKKNDVALFRRNSGKLVMHRVVRVRKDSYDFCGDNQVHIEKRVPKEWVIAVMVAFYRDNTYIELTNPKYISYYKKINRTRFIRLIKHYIKRLKEKLTHK